MSEDTAIGHSMALPNPSAFMWIALESVREHSWKPEVTYHICGPRPGSGKVPGVGGQISGDPPRRAMALFSRLPWMLNNPSSPDNTGDFVFHWVYWNHIIQTEQKDTENDAS